MPKPEHSRVVQADGGHAAVRTTLIEATEPGFVVLQVEGWESDPAGDVAEGATEAPVLHHTIPLGMIADGQVDVGAQVERTEREQALQVARMVRARAALAAIPRGTPRPGHTVLAPHAGGPR